MEDAKDQERVEGDAAAPDVAPSSRDEEAAIKKKYGGIVPKKPPLISKVLSLVEGRRLRLIDFRFMLVMLAYFLSTRTMNVLFLILRTGHWESKMLRSQRDLLKPSDLNCSRLNSKQDTGSPLMRHLMMKMEEVPGLKKQLRPTSNNNAGVLLYRMEGRFVTWVNLKSHASYK